MMPSCAFTTGSCRALAGACRGRFSAAPAPRPADAVFLAPHRAIYDLKLTNSRGNRALESVRGRIVYDFSGSACEGYALQFRQVSETDIREGKAALSDLRTTTWEDGDAKNFRFNSQNLLNEKPRRSGRRPCRPLAEVGHRHAQEAAAAPRRARHPQRPSCWTASNATGAC